MQSKFSIQGEAVILQKTPFVFDASMREVLWYGMYGMTLAVLPPGDEKKPEKIVQDIWKYKATHINFVPSMLNAFLLYLEGSPEKVSLCQSLQYVFCCGEPLTTSLTKRFYGIFHGISLCNLYGPTEATIDVTYYPCDPNNIPEYIPIGYPLDNCRIYIINPCYQLQPIGTVGELCIAGDCLSAGYYKKPDITQQKYVPNPFEDGGKLYHSGDLARWLPDGKIQCLGRIDHQVKIRGYRIELEEVRKYLLQIDAIKETVVTVCSDENGDKFICAYCIFNKVITVSEIMQILLQNLPEYMVPSFFVSIDEIPTNTNGKLAKDKLPLPVTNIPIGSTYVPPETKEEKMLAEVWREVLNVDQVGVYDNFFHLGGNSIKAIQVVSILKKKYNAELLLDKMYALESVRELALEITYEKREEDMVQAIEKREYYPLSSAQNRIYLSSVLKSSGQADNNSILTYRIQGELDPVRLKAAFQSIINNHEILRTTYHLLEGTVYQKVEENIEFTLEEVTMQENESIDDAFREFNTVFDMTAAPLIRATVVHMKPMEFFLFIAVHHIAFDGFSRNILIEELSKGYENRLCEKPEFQYKEYAYYQTENLSSDRMLASEQYWMEQFKQLPPEKELFTDFERPSEVDYSGDSVMFSVSPDVVEKVHSIAEKNQATDFQVMFSAYSLLLNKYSNIDDIVIGIPEVGRNVRGTESLIGMFVNTLPIRTYPNGDKTVKSFIQEIKTGLIAAITHDEYPYDVLVRKLKIKPNLGRNSLFDTMFAFQNIETTELNLSGVVTELYPIADQASIFDLVLYIYVGEKMEGKFSFSKKLYKESTINMLIQDYICLIRQMDIDNEITLDEILTTKDYARKEQMKKHKIEFNF